MKSVEAINRFFDHYGWAMWLSIVGWYIWPPSASPPFTAFAGLMLGIHLHRRFGTTLVGRGRERMEWER